MRLMGRDTIQLAGPHDHLAVTAHNDELAFEDGADVLLLVAMLLLAAGTEDQHHQAAGVAAHHAVLQEVALPAALRRIGCPKDLDRHALVAPGGAAGR